MKSKIVGLLLLAKSPQIDEWGVARTAVPNNSKLICRIDVLPVVRCLQALLTYNYHLTLD